MEPSQLITQLRKSHGLTQAELAYGICSQSTISNFENKRKSISIDLYYKLLRKIGNSSGYKYGKNDSHDIFTNILVAILTNQISLANELLKNNIIQKKVFDELNPYYSYKYYLFKGVIYFFQSNNFEKSIDLINYSEEFLENASFEYWIEYLVTKYIISYQYISERKKNDLIDSITLYIERHFEKNNSHFYLYAIVFLFITHEDTKLELVNHTLLDIGKNNGDISLINFHYFIEKLLESGTIHHENLTVICNLLNSIKNDNILCDKLFLKSLKSFLIFHRSNNISILKEYYLE